FSRYTLPNAGGGCDVKLFSVSFLRMSSVKSFLQVSKWVVGSNRTSRDRQMEEGRVREGPQQDQQERNWIVCGNYRKTDWLLLSKVEPVAVLALLRSSPGTWSHGRCRSRLG